MPRLIPLQNWAERHFDPAPGIRTLRNWARNGRIQPRPILVGREWRAREDAAYVPEPEGTPSSAAVLQSKDTVVNDILTRGQTQNRRQA